MRFAKKSLGQNFLVDANYQRKIVSAAEKPYQGETVIEIGPGQGALTQHLQGFAKNLILIEKDRDLAFKLATNEKIKKDIEIIPVDFLKWDLTQLKDASNVVVANLPYNVSTQILIALLQNMKKFTRLILMFQKEVAQRCVAESDTKAFGILSVWAQLFTNVRKICDVPPTAFRPQPKITSTVLEFTPNGIYFDANQKEFISFVKKIFSQRRKKIGSLLREERAATTDVEMLRLFDLRAEALTITEMQKLYWNLKSS